MFDVSFDYIRIVDLTQLPVSGTNRDNTEKVNEIFENPRFQNFVKVFGDPFERPRTKMRTQAKVRFFLNTVRIF